MFSSGLLMAEMMVRMNNLVESSKLTELFMIFRCIILTLIVACFCHVVILSTKFKELGFV